MGDCVKARANSERACPPSWLSIAPFCLPCDGQYHTWRFSLNTLHVSQTPEEQPGQGGGERRDPEPARVPVSAGTNQPSIQGTHQNPKATSRKIYNPRQNSTLLFSRDFDIPSLALGTPAVPVCMV